MTPGYVSTNMAGNPKANGFDIVEPHQLAEQTVNAMGLCPTLCGAWTHELYFGLVSVLPKWLLVKIVLGMLSAERNIEREAVHKKH